MELASDPWVIIYWRYNINLELQPFKIGNIVKWWLFICHWAVWNQFFKLLIKRSNYLIPKIHSPRPFSHQTRNVNFKIKKLLYKSFKNPKIILILNYPMNFLLLHSLFFFSFLKPFYIILNGYNIRGLTLINLANIKLRTAEYITDGLQRNYQFLFHPLAFMKVFIIFLS